MTEMVSLRVHVISAPCGAVQLLHVIQREPTATEESPCWLHKGNDDAFSKSAVILALRAGIPWLVAPG